ncbi:hypothetical protein L484_025997 [Morus notabilis]|uniref:Uncharacterized protein n=1 Tax=Morus notabilis TaxID=981085 RepID=W9RI86_9ROSA|nr:hypothetical protein L484_025997 [Morus notabilis]
MKTEADQEKRMNRRFGGRKSLVLFGSVTDTAWTTFMEGGLRRTVGHDNSPKKKAVERRGETPAALQGKTTTRRMRDQRRGRGWQRGAEATGRR